jgi:transposase InsO family protein
VNALCQITGLSRAGFYRWRVPRQASPVEMELRDQMQKVALESPAYGYRRITQELRQRGFEVNHKRVLRMMREDNLLCVRRRALQNRQLAVEGLCLVPWSPKCAEILQAPALRFHSIAKDLSCC